MTIQSDLEYNALIRRVQGLIDQGRLADAEAALTQILKKRRNDPHAMWLLVDVHWRDNRHDEAISVLRRYVKLNPRDLKAQVLLGTYLARRGRSQQALSGLNRLRRKHPDDPLVIRALAEAHDLGGSGDKALETLEPLVAPNDETDPDTALLLANLLIQRRENERAAALIGRQLAREDLPPGQRKRFGYLLGKACENLDRPGEAHEAYAAANRLDEGRFDEQVCIDLTERMIEVFDPDTVERLPSSDVDSELPVFVISRPRSGSTLVERIIGSHPAAHAAGEISTLTWMTADLPLRINSTLPMPECIADLDSDDVNDLAREYLSAVRPLARNAKRITDKTLGNYWLVGLIRLMLPRARVIDLRRNPLDTCLACWTVDLGAQHPGSCRLDHLALEYKMHVRLMEHWHRVLEEPMLRVNYEDLVADQEAWSRTIIDFLDLPWSDRCLTFYESSGKHGAGTAAPTHSYSQVTKPIYRSSVGRADRFEPYLGPVRDVLGLDADEAPLGHSLRF